MYFYQVKTPTHPHTHLPHPTNKNKDFRLCRICQKLQSHDAEQHFGFLSAPQIQMKRIRIQMLIKKVTPYECSSVIFSRMNRYPALSFLDDPVSLFPSQTTCLAAMHYVAIHWNRGFPSCGRKAYNAMQQRARKQESWKYKYKYKYKCKYRQTYYLKYVSWREI